MTPHTKKKNRKKEKDVSQRKGKASQNLYTNPRNLKSILYVLFVIQQVNSKTSYLRPLIDLQN